MRHPLKVMVLYGGKSGEHEVSLVSAASVLANLDSEKYQIIPVGMDKEGNYYLNDYCELLSYPQALPVTTQHSRVLPSLIQNGRLAIEADVVFPVVHGPLYEDGCLQGLLKLVDVAFVGCDVLASAIGMDKDMARRIACLGGDVKSTRYSVLSWHANEEETERFCQQAAAEFGWPLFVKPCSMGSSVGIHKVNNKEELYAAVADARRYDEAILIEEYVSGREIELAVLENITPTLSPKVSLPGEIRVHHADGFYSYCAKYLESEHTELIVPALLDDNLIQQLQKLSATIFTRLKCKGMARVDFFVNDKTGNIFFNEINSIPGFTPISMYPKMWQASGLSYKELLDRLISLAVMHHQCRTQLVTNYQ